MKYLSVLLFIGFIFSAPALAADSVKIHAPVAESFTCSEHWDGQFQYPGDALGTDCVVQAFRKEDGRMFMVSYQGKGYKNEDWFGYGKELLSPCDCRVININVNKITNTPGKMTPGQSSSIIFQKKDGTSILLAHIGKMLVKEGDTVNAGDVVGHIGNNGYSRNPHVHIGAWKGDEPLQIQFDQKTLALKYRREKNNDN